MAQDTEKLERKVVLYHGSLQELNSRNPSEQYRFSDKSMGFISGEYFWNNSWFENISNELRENGYDGIVNRKTCFGRLGIIDTSPVARVEGTPIVRVDRG